MTTQRMIIWLAAALVGWVIGYPKERGGAGFTLGLLFGPLGWLLLLCMSDDSNPALWVAGGLVISFAIGLTYHEVVGTTPWRSGSRRPIAAAQAVQANARQPVWAAPRLPRKPSAQEANAEILHKYGGAY